MLKHPLRRTVTNEQSVHYALEFSGHRIDRDIWRYVQLEAQSLADVIDEFD